MGHITRAADRAGKVGALRDRIRAVESEGAVVREGAARGDAAGCSARADLQRAGIDRGGAGVDVGAREDERAGAVFGEGAGAADLAGVGAVARGVCCEGEAGEVQVARARNDTEVLVGPERKRAGIHRGGAGVVVPRARKRERAGAVFREAAAGAVGGKVAADGQSIAGHIEDRAAGFHDRGSVCGGNGDGPAGGECAAVEVDGIRASRPTDSGDGEIAPGRAGAEVQSRVRRSRASPNNGSQIHGAGAVDRDRGNSIGDTGAELKILCRVIECAATHGHNVVGPR